MTEVFETVATITFRDIDYEVFISGEFSYGIEKGYGADADGNRGIDVGYCDLEVGMRVWLNEDEKYPWELTDYADPEFIKKCEWILTVNFEEYLEENEG